MRRWRAIVMGALLGGLSPPAAAQLDYPVDRLVPPPHTTHQTPSRVAGPDEPENLCGPVPLAPVFASPPPEESSFGQVIDLQGGRLIVGDPFHDEPFGQEDVGAAYFFEQEGAGWTPRGRVAMPEVGLFANFGWSVAIHGEYALASTPFTRAGRGEVFVFQRHAGPTGVEWRLAANIKPDPEEPSLFYFGWDLDLSGSIAAISGLFSTTEPNGWVELHANTQGSWRPLARLRPPDGTIFDDFGRSVSIFGSRVLVGAPYHPDPTHEGAAYLFHKTDAGWELDTKLTPPGLQPNDRAGWSVALDHDTAVVGTPYTANEAPKIWVYRLAGGLWSLETTILTPLDNEYVESDFARSLDLKGDTLIVGAPYAQIWGAAYVYRRIQGSWSFLGRVRFDDVSTPMLFPTQLGRSVAVEGDTAFASSPSTTLLDDGRIITGMILPIDLSGPPFAITRQPADLPAEEGGSAVFEAAAVGPGTLEYQWFKTGVPIVDDHRVSGARTPTLSIQSLVIEDSALYSLRVSSELCGSVESRAALLDMGVCIQIVAAPAPMMIVAGSPLILHCETRGILPLRFQWTRAGTNLEDDGRITGSQTPTLTIDPTLPEDQSAYRLEITSQCGEARTNEAGVSFLPCVEFVGQPADIFTFVGDNIRLEADATSHVALTYRWWRNGSPLLDGGRYSGASTPTLVITGATVFDAARFMCSVSCAFNQAFSREAAVTLNPAGCLGDANGDRLVNMVDLSTVLIMWGLGYRPLTGPGDSDRDGLVGFRDLTMVLSRYGSLCP